MHTDPRRYLAGPLCHARVIQSDWTIRTCQGAGTVLRSIAYPYPGAAVWWCAKHDPAVRTA